VTGENGDNNFALHSKFIRYKYHLALHLALVVLARSYWRKVGKNSLSYKIRSSTLTPTAGFRFVNAIILGLYNQNTCL
jgi:hypothetical protein